MMVPKKISTSLPIALLTSLQLFFFSFLKLYYGNIFEFTFSEEKLTLNLAILTAFSTIILYFILQKIEKNQLYKTIITIILSFNILIWIQGNILVWDYGIFDGEAINWNSFKYSSMIDTSMWIVLITILVILKTKIFRIKTLIISWLLIISTISLGVDIYNAPEQPSFKSYNLSETNKFNFSKEKNVIVIVLDAFRSDIFKELTTENQQYKNFFDGFTYYQDTISGYPKTYAAIPLMLTGQYYKNDIPIQDFIKKSFLNNSLPKILIENGFETNLFPLLERLIYIDELTASNAVADNSILIKPANIQKLFISTWFRYSPSIIKEKIYKFHIKQDIEFIKNRTMSFLENMNKKGKVDLNIPTFKFYHLNGSHPPLELNENMEYEEMEFSEKNYKRQSEGSLKVINKFFEKLKKLGIYDNSMIVVLSDHGIGGLDDTSIKMDENYIDNSTQNIFKPQVKPNIKASSLSLLLIKPFESKGILKTSYEPKSTADLPKIILSELKIIDYKPSSEQRSFFNFNWDGKYTRLSQEFLPDMEEFKIDGFSWLDNSWTTTHKTYLPKKIVDSSPKEYTLGKKLDFGENGTGLQYLGFGWGNPSNGLIWSYNPIATISIPTEKIKTDLLLSAFFIPYTTPTTPSKQIINIYIENEKIGSWEASEITTYILKIPKDKINKTKINIKFEIPTATALTPESKEKLGIALKKLTLSQLP